MIFSRLYIWQIREELEADDAPGVREVGARRSPGRWQAERRVAACGVTPRALNGPKAESLRRWKGTVFIRVERGGDLVRGGAGR